MKLSNFFALKTQKNHVQCDSILFFVKFINCSQAKSNLIQ